MKKSNYFCGCASLRDRTHLKNHIHNETFKYVTGTTPLITTKLRLSTLSAMPHPFVFKNRPRITAKADTAVKQIEKINETWEKRIVHKNVFSVAVVGLEPTLKLGRMRRSTDFYSASNVPRPPIPSIGAYTAVRGFAWHRHPLDRLLSVTYHSGDFRGIGTTLDRLEAVTSHCG